MRLISTLCFALFLQKYSVECERFQDEGWVYVVSALDGMVLSTKERTEPRSNSGIQVLMEPRSENKLNQLWKLDQDGCLLNAASFECLTVNSGENGASLKLQPRSSNLLQKWSHDSEYYLRSGMNDFVLQRTAEGGLTIGKIDEQPFDEGGQSLKQKWLLRADGQVIDKNMLEKISLARFPLARTMDNTPAVYYRQTERSEANKFLIYLQGGGYCVPRIPDMDCESRCEKHPYLCTAWEREYFDTTDSSYGDNVFSEDPEVNPAFHNFHKVFLPYSSSDVHAGTREASWFTNNYTFHGKFIFKAMADDLIENTWITQAEQVILMGGSAGAIGTEANCDYFSALLHDFNPDIDVRCISDSGSMYPFSVHTQNCYPQLLEYTAYNIWKAESDQSCEEDNPSKLPCISFGTAYRYADTPILILMSSEDTVIRICYAEDDAFWDSWRQELELTARQILQDRPDVAMFLPNCPFHVASTHVWSSMEVPVLDGEDGQTILLKDLVYNFVNGQQPIQAIDSMDVRNPACNNNHN